MVPDSPKSPKSPKIVVFWKSLKKSPDVLAFYPKNLKILPSCSVFLWTLLIEAMEASKKFGID